MANRIVIGQRGSSYGLWVSKPTFDVLTTSQSNMLFTMDGRITQILARGAMTFPANSSGQTQTIALSGTNGVVPMGSIWYAYHVAVGTSLMQISQNSGVTINLTPTSLALTMTVNFNSATVYNYTLLLEA